MANTVNNENVNKRAFNVLYLVHNSDVRIVIISPLMINPLDKIHPSNTALGFITSKMQ
ncbi:hypothetical protein HMPREF1536_03963 [Parabacteroides gordonii MS-1 = DSM 23371]|uniref:Uncharacterized protein n=1 Tax=Parabacteroides gordonii MS-1 = DSM 23371 TaxID=1203610 RepID=A0A0F5IZ21_9BACT|nr:hypothetical protein HMPREF1536_03963 [Parabacteroides gordonii MS-1 = DSM 23371]